MHRIEVEAWAQRVIRRVLTGGGTEDQLVELKRDWPTDIPKAARRIAGHANSAFGEPVLWLIGVDERERSLHVTSDVDPAKWYAQIRAEFSDQWCPLVRIYHVPHEQGTVMALLFETDGAPFVVKAPQERLEVPWREATGVRSARRSELFALLSEPIRLPNFEILSVEVWCGEGAGGIRKWTMNCGLYITPRSEKVVFFPYRKIECVIAFPPGQMRIDLTDLVWVNADTGAGTPRASLKYHQIECDGVQMTAAGPGYAEVHAEGSSTGINFDELADAELQMFMAPAGSEIAAVLTAQLTRRDVRSMLGWVYPPPRMDSA